MSTFKYLLIPAEGDMQELEHPAVAELGQGDPFIERLKQYFGAVQAKVDKDVLLKGMSVHAKRDLSTEITADMQEQVLQYKSLDIFPITVPTKDTGFMSVSLYCDDKGVAKDLPLNKRAIGLVQACGYEQLQQFRGDVFLGRIFDNDDDWRRVDISLKDCSSDASWVKASCEVRKRTGAKGAQSLSQLTQGNGAAPAAQDDAQQKALQDKFVEATYGTGAATETEHYSWKNEDAEIEIDFKAPVTGKKEVDVKISRTALRVAIRGETLIDIKLFAAVDADSSAWTLSDGRLSIVLAKCSDGLWRSLEATN